MVSKKGYGKIKIREEKERGMIKMFSKGSKKGACFLILLVAILTLFGITNAEATRRVVNMNRIMENEIMRNRKVEVGGKLFDVCINQAEKTITIKGYVDDWDEMDQVEDYFEHRGPSDYQVQCELDFPMN